MATPPTTTEVKEVPLKCTIRGGIEVKSHSDVGISFQSVQVLIAYVNKTTANCRALLADSIYSTSPTTAIISLQMSAFNCGCTCIAELVLKNYVDYTEPASPCTLWLAYGTGIVSLS